MNRVAKLCLFALIFLVGCSDQNQQSSETAHKLEILGKVMMKWPPKKAIFFKTVDKLVAASVAKRYLVDTLDYTRDGWGEKFSWEDKLHGKTTIVRIISSGRNDSSKHFHWRGPPDSVNWSQWGNPHSPWEKLS